MLKNLLAALILSLFVGNAFANISLGRPLKVYKSVAFTIEQDNTEKKDVEFCELTCNYYHNQTMEFVNNTTNAMYGFCSAQYANDVNAEIGCMQLWLDWKITMINILINEYGSCGNSGSYLGVQTGGIVPCSGNPS